MEIAMLTESDDPAPLNASVPVTENAGEDPITLGRNLRDRITPFGWIENRGPNNVRLVTDHAGTTPLYYAQVDSQVFAGTSPLAVFKQMRQGSLDPVSVADFLLNGVVCYPFTLFKNVYAAPPGAVTDVTPREVISTTYYRPQEIESKESVSYWGDELRDRLSEALLAGLEGKTNIKVLFSGGEDSRAVVSLLPPDLECELITFADAYNREVRLAENAARALGRPLRFLMRPEGFYRTNLAERCLIVGGTHCAQHTHVFGPLSDSLRDADAVVGGFGSDTMFKSVYMSNVDRSLWRFGPEGLSTKCADQLAGVRRLANKSWVRSEVAEAADARRWAHDAQLEKFRPCSRGNWHLKWPLGSQQPHFAHYLATKRACRSVVEPFLAPQVYDVAARMPDEFKVDRKAFRAAFARGMGKAGWLTTSSGQIPRLGGQVGYWVERATLFARQSRGRTTASITRLAGRTPVDQGSWSADHLVYAPDSSGLTSSNLEQIQSVLSSVLTAHEAKNFFDPSSSSVPDLSRLRMLQVAYLMLEGDSGST